MRAQAAHETLRDDARQSRREKIRGHAHVEQTEDRAERVLRMQRRKEQMTRQRSTHRHLRRLRIADLAEHDLVDVRAQHGAKPCGIRHARLLVHLDLIDALDAVLGRIFDRHDVAFGRIDLRESRIERRRLARIDRSRDQNHAAGLMAQAAEKRLIVHGKSEIPDGKKRVRAVQDAKNRLLPREERQGRQTKIDGFAALRRHVRYAPVLRHAALHAFKMCHDLQSRKQKRMHLPGDRCMRFQ